ncbi:NAD(P)H-dependent flavin oxidoreductase [Ferrovibrio sp.]|jgi:nitronate monooxygenase|uniref:NAD(P)H-dependent flavin oxidoreductase n=1 Tax=Ferrovibrio sp. TaxID=1917215 RepID=UPI003516B5A0
MSLQFGSRQLAARFMSRLQLPVIAGPMFLISGPDLVIGCCNAGVVGSFPSLNARTTVLLDEWLTRIAAETSGPNAAPYAVNMIVHPSNTRLEEDMMLVEKHKAPLVIASVGSPANIVARVHAYGGLVFSDVASLKHARRAAEVGVDGLILLCAGSGGNTGWLNPFAFVGAVREFFDGPIVLAGAISRGQYIHVAQEMGADMAYIGTSFIVTRESMANDKYRDMLLDANADDIILTAEITGIPANMLRQSLESAGLKTGKKHEGGFSLLREVEMLKAWRDIWSAGHGVGDVRAIESVADLVRRLQADYLAARNRRNVTAA